jgi:hypothetical protein
VEIAEPNHSFHLTGAAGSVARVQRFTAQLGNRVPGPTGRAGKTDGAAPEPRPQPRAKLSLSGSLAAAAKSPRLPGMVQGDQFCSLRQQTILACLLRKVVHERRARYQHELGVLGLGLGIVL